MPRPTNALIVDDETHVRAFLRLVLREVGITECWEAPDGNTGLQLAAQHQPELILLDINMPQMSGMDVLAKLNAELPEIPVIMVTANSSVSNVNEAARLGAIGYVLKHAPRDQAIAALKDAIDSLAEEPEATS
jgi:two-component system chemotaxis response regulator CheY